SLGVKRAIQPECTPKRTLMQQSCPIHAQSPCPKYGGLRYCKRLNFRGLRFSRIGAKLKI
ncbi:MAG: hypothetical protein PV344_04625, partial [Anaplasma sp.]|nr:hypothetical protein [Anaplasma sp.]